MTAKEVTDIIKKWKTTIDGSLSNNRGIHTDTEKAERRYALRIIEYILKDVEEVKKQQ